MLKNKNKKSAKIKSEVTQPEEKVVVEKEEETKSHEERKIFNTFGGILWALFLVFIGILFLLNNFGIVPWNIWGTLWRLWPLFIIFAGIQIITGRSKILNLALGCLLFVFFSIIIAIVISINNSSFRGWIKSSLNIDLGSIVNLRVPSEKRETITVGSNDFEDVKARKVNLEVTAGEFTLAENNTDDYFKVDATFPEGHGQPIVGKEKRNDTLEIQFNTEEKNFWSLPFAGSTKRKYDFSLGNLDIPTDLDLSMTAGDGDIQMDSLVLSNLQIEMTAGDLQVDLKEGSIPEEMSIKLTAGSLKLSLPDNIGIKVNYDLTAGSLEVGDQEFDGASEDGTYETENYDRATKTLEINIEMTAGDVTIELDN